MKIYGIADEDSPGHVVYQLDRRVGPEESARLGALWAAQPALRAVQFELKEDRLAVRRADFGPNTLRSIMDLLAHFDGNGK